jgi:polar amino acid transport system substrate-binding protein
MRHFLLTFTSRRLLVSLTGALALMSTSAQADPTLDKIKQRGKVTIGVLVNGGPFGSIDPANQQLIGWNPELARALANGLGVQADLVQVQTATRVQFLQAGKVDLLIASMELNPERADILGYAPTPFYRVGGTAAVLKSSGITQWSELRGKSVCVSQGSSFAKPLTELGAEVHGYKSSSDSLLALRGGNCVAAVHDSTLIHPLLRTTAGRAVRGMDPERRAGHHRRCRQGGAGLAPHRLADQCRKALGYRACSAPAARTAGEI